MKELLSECLAFGAIIREFLGVPGRFNRFPRPLLFFEHHGRKPRLFGLLPALLQLALPRLPFRLNLLLHLGPHYGNMSFLLGHTHSSGFHHPRFELDEACTV